MSVVITTSTTVTDTALVESRKRIIKILGIIEVVLGALAVLLDIITIAVVKVSLTNYSGFWGGAWILIAGGLGIGAGGPNTNSCLVNAHMGLSIVSAIFSGITMAIGFAAFGIFLILQTLGIPAILLTIIALIAFILNIVSASFCCMLNTAMGMPACCCGGGGGGAVVVAQTTNPNPPAYAQS